MRGMSSLSIFVSILIFSVIVIIHELGHFIAAKRNGILVEEFAVGMGPKLFSIKKGETVYSLRLFPIGGFCQMLGEDSSDKTDERAFGSKTVFQRIVVVLAGVAMNFALAFIIFICVTIFTGVSQPIVHSVFPNTPAAKIGLMPGDRIIRVNNMHINIANDLSFAMSDVHDEKINLTVKRNNQLINYNVQPVLNTQTKGYVLGFEKQMKSGLFQTVEGYNKASLLDVFHEAFFNIFFYIKMTTVALTRLVTMKLSLKELAGPIGIVNLIGETYTTTVSKSVFYAILAMLNFMGILSANIAVFNLLPVPALDGGRLIFLLIEGLRKKPVNPKYENIIHLTGFVLLMIFAVVIAINDIIKII